MINRPFHDKGGVDWTPEDQQRGWRDMDYYELRAKDVGKPWLHAFGYVWPVSGFIGRILPQDVGKRVYWRGNTKYNRGILQVENNEQRNARTARRNPFLGSAGTMGHTPLPWKISNESDGTFIRGKHGGLVASMESGYQQMRDLDARFIVRACNSRGNLLKALENLVKWMDDSGLSSTKPGGHGQIKYGPIEYSVVTDARAAIAETEEI